MLSPQVCYADPPRCVTSRDESDLDFRRRSTFTLRVWSGGRRGCPTSECHAIDRAMARLRRRCNGKNTLGHPAGRSEAGGGVSRHAGNDSLERRAVQRPVGAEADREPGGDRSSWRHPGGLPGRRPGQGADHCRCRSRLLSGAGLPDVCGAAHHRRHGFRRVGAPSLGARRKRPTGCLWRRGSRSRWSPAQLGS
jgi:hypothetical protein